MKRFLALLLPLFLVAACETAPSGSNTGAGGGSGFNDGSTFGTSGLTDADGTPVNVGDRVFFATDSHTLSNEAQSTLRLQAEWLNENPNTRITIEGHCDERGTREYNLALGERRAASVKRYLSSLGVSASRIETVSYGKERPAVLGSNASAWAQNRRGVTVISNL